MVLIRSVTRMEHSDLKASYLRSYDLIGLKIPFYQSNGIQTLDRVLIGSLVCHSKAAVLSSTMASYFDGFMQANTSSITISSHLSKVPIGRPVNHFHLILHTAQLKRNAKVSQ